MPLVPLIGQSRKSTPRAAHSRASRWVSAGEIVLICTTVRPRAVAARPRAPSTTSSTAASEGSTTQIGSATSATTTAEGAARPPIASSARLRSGTTSWPITW